MPFWPAIIGYSGDDFLLTAGHVTGQSVDSTFFLFILRVQDPVTDMTQIPLAAQRLSSCDPVFFLSPKRCGSA